MVTRDTKCIHRRLYYKSVTGDWDRPRPYCRAQSLSQTMLVCRAVYLLAEVDGKKNCNYA